MMLSFFPDMKTIFILYIQESEILQHCQVFSEIQGVSERQTLRLRQLKDVADRNKFLQLWKLWFA